MFTYIVLYKPFKVMSQFSPEGDKLTLKDVLPGIASDIYPVGRLDYDSEGLLLLTNDKSLNNLLLNPKKAHERTYYVQVEGQVTQQAIDQLKAGVVIQIDGKQHKTARAKVKEIETPDLPDRNPPIRYRANIPTSWLSITLTEGKNRQVRRMTAAVGFPTLRLVRHSMGKISIDGYLPGECKVFHSGIKQLLGL